MFNSVRVLKIPHHKIKKDMKAKVGQYFYQRFRGSYGVFRYNQVTEDSSSASLVGYFSEREEARRYVWEMNGWGVPKRALA